MPRIPTVEGPSVALGAAPNAYQQTPGNVAGAGLVRAQQFGQVADAADAWRRSMQRMQDEADAVRVDDAINRAKEAQLDLTFGKERGFTNVKGLAALQRDSGQPLADEYAQTYQKTLSEIGNSLGNERQKRAFGMRANDMLTGFRGQVMQHEGQELRGYQASVYDGTVANRKQEVGYYYNDPTKIDEALLSIEGAVAAKGRLTGASAVAIEAAARKESSNALVVAMSSALERNDVTMAAGLLKKYGPRMDADELLRARSAIDKQVDTSIGLKVATDVVQRTVVPATAPSDFNRLVAITMQSESGGRRFGADGKLLTSPAGARGEMQVLDGTNKDPGYGVTPARDDSPEERARVGRDYLGAMVKRYDGDLAKAWAAYNAGPGRVDQELKDAAKRGQPGAWLSNLPAETQAYVEKNLRAFQAGEGRPAMPTLQDVHNAVREQVGTSSPLRLKTALDEATRQYEEAQKAVKQREDEATTNAYRWLASNGGRTSLMPPRLRDAVPPKELDNLLNFGQRVARGEDRTNPAVYQRLSDPAVLKSLSDGEFYRVSMSELSEADRKHFAQQRGRLASGAEGDKPGDLNTGAVKSTLDSRLRELGTDPTPKDGSSEAERVGAIRQFVDRSLIAAQQSAGKKFTDAEVQKHIDGLFAQTDVVKGWFSDTGKQLLAMKPGDIPSEVKKRLKDDFAAAGITDPTDGQLLSAYFLAKSAQPQVRKITPLPAAPKQ